MFMDNLTPSRKLMLPQACIVAFRFGIMGESFLSTISFLVTRVVEFNSVQSGYIQFVLLFRLYFSKSLYNSS